MGMVAPAMAVVGTVAGIASQRSQAAANNRAVRLQQQANNRATQIRLMGLDMQSEQVKQQYELDTLAIESRAELAELNFQVQSIQRNLQTAQQLAGIDAATAESVLQSTAKQFEAARAAYLQKQQVQQQQTDTLQRAGQMYAQDKARLAQVSQSIASGDMQLAALLARDAGYAMTNDAQGLASFKQEQYEVMKAMLESTALDEGIQQDLLLNSQYSDYLNRAIEASLASQQAAINAETNAASTQANEARKSTQIADKGSQRVEGLARALLPQAREIELNQANIDRTYALENIANNRLEAQFANYAGNMQLQQRVQTPSLLSDLAAIGSSAVPLFSQMNFFSRSQAPQTAGFTPTNTGITILPRPQMINPFTLNDYHYTG